MIRMLFMLALMALGLAASALWLGRVGIPGWFARLPTAGGERVIDLRDLEIPWTGALDDVDSPAAPTGDSPRVPAAPERPAQGSAAGAEAPSAPELASQEPEGERGDGDGLGLQTPPDRETRSPSNGEWDEGASSPLTVSALAPRSEAVDLERRAALIRRMLALYERLGGSP